MGDTGKGRARVDEPTNDLEGTSYQVLQKEIYRLTGIDLRLYKENQVKRLLESARRRYNAASFGQLLERLDDDPGLLHRFKGRLSINVSEFFRDAPRFDYLARHVLPNILRDNRRPRVWSAGCSVGCEPYSLAMLLAEEGVLNQSTVIGSDIDEEAVERARKGVYWESEVRSVAPDLRGQYLIREGGLSESEMPQPLRRRSDGSLESLYRVRDDIKRAVTFRVEDLFNCDYERNFDLIVCRNVTIYFTEDAKRELHGELCASLRPGGYLFVGGTEIIFQAEEMGLENPAPFFYRRHT